MSTNGVPVERNLPVKISSSCGCSEPVAEERYRDFLLSIAPGSEWLDLGCGRSLIREWLPNAHRDQVRLREESKRIVGIDAGADDVAKNPYIHEGVVGNIDHLPFAGGSFDLMTAQMVIEHLAVPGLMLRECWRVLRAGGSLLFLTPNLANPFVAAARLVPYSVRRPLVAKLQAREERDIFPTHYRLNTLSDVCREAKAVGFSVERVETVSGAPNFGQQSMLRHLETLWSWVEPRSMRSDIVAHLVKPRGQQVQESSRQLPENRCTAATGKEEM